MSSESPELTTLSPPSSTSPVISNDQNGRRNRDRPRRGMYYSAYQTTKVHGAK